MDTLAFANIRGPMIKAIGFRTEFPRSVEHFHKTGSVPDFSRHVVAVVFSSICTILSTKMRASNDYMITAFRETRKKERKKERRKDRNHNLTR